MSAKEDKQTKVLVIDTFGFFEIEIPVEIDVNWYIRSEECRKICAEAILSHVNSLTLERVKGE